MVMAGSGQAASSRSGRKFRRSHSSTSQQQPQNNLSNTEISRRLSEAEAENHELRERLAETSAKLHEAEARLSTSDGAAASDDAVARLDAQLRQAEADNDALRRRLSELSPRWQESEGAEGGGATAPPGPAEPSSPAEGRAAEPGEAVEAAASADGSLIGFARDAKLDGNESLKVGDFEQAVAHYRRGLARLLPVLADFASAGGRDGASAGELVEEAVELEVSLQLNIAHASLKSEKWWATVEAADAVLERRPGNEKALYRRGVAYARLEKKDNAVSDLREALQQNPNNPDARRELRDLVGGGGADDVWRRAFAKEGMKRRQDGADEAEKKEDEQPPASPPPQPQEQPFKLPGTPVESSTVRLEETLTKARDVLSTGTLAMTSGQLDVALTLFRGGLEALRSLSTSGAMAVATAVAAELGGDCGDAALLSEAVTVEVELLVKIASISIRKRDYRGALDAAEQALQRRPTDAKAIIAREAAIEGLKVSEAEAQAAWTNWTPPLQPASPSRPSTCGSQRSGVTESNPLEIIRMCVCAAKGQLSLGEGAYKARDFDMAAEQFNQALRMVEVLPVHQHAQQLGVRDIETADVSTLSPDAKMLREAIDLEITLQTKLALLCLKRKDYEGCVEAATIVLDRRPANPETLYRRGLAFLRLEQKGAACEDFRRLLAEDPSMSCIIRNELEAAYKVPKGDTHPDWVDMFDIPAADGEAGAAEEACIDGSDSSSSSSDSGGNLVEDVVAAEDLEDEANGVATAREDVAAQFADFITNGAAAAVVGEEKALAAKAQFDHIYDKVNEIRKNGNELFNAGEIDQAVWLYQEGLKQAAKLSKLSDQEFLRRDKSYATRAQNVELNLWLNLALASLKIEHFDEAERAATEALRLDPTNVKGLFRRAQALTARAKSLDDDLEARQLRTRASADLRAVLAVEPKNAEARKELTALKSASTGNPNGSGGGAAAAPSEDNPFAGMFNGDPQALRERHRAAKERRLAEEAGRLREQGNTSHRVGDYHAAEQHYSAALLLDTTSAPLFLNRAAARLMLDEYPLALEDCEKALALQPNSGKAYTRASKCKQMLGDFDGAEELLKKGLEAVSSTTERDDVEAQRRCLSQTLRMLREVEQCLHVDLEGVTEAKRALRLVEDLERQKQLPASMLRPFRLRAILQSRDTAATAGPGRASGSGGAAEAQRLAEELAREPPRGIARTELLFWKASALLMGGDRARAKVTLRDIVASESEDAAERPVCPAAAALLARLTEADGAKDRGNVFFKDRRWEDAVECYEEALRVSPKELEFSAVLHTNISAALRKVEHREGDALKHASKAIEANPKYAKAFFRRGVLHYDAGKWSQSFEDFRRAKELEPNLQGLDQWLRRGRHAMREGKDRKNHYRELGLLCDCEQDEIKRKYRQLARECHPDKVRDAPPAERTAAEARFKAVNEANEILGNEGSRREYDFGNNADHDFDHGCRGGNFFRGRGDPFGGFSRRPDPSRFRGWDASDDDCDWM